MAVWEPKMSKPGRELWNCRKRYILVHGPRKGGKSLAIADKLLRNAMTFPGSDTCILTRTIAKGEAGVWRNLTKPGGVVSKWQKAGFAKYHGRRKGYAGPGYMPSSKVPYFQIQTGGDPSTFQMHTLAEDERVEDKFKDMTFDFVYIVEADSFERDVYTTMRQTLRSMVVPFSAQQLILDMNPPAQGRKHWAFKFIESPEDDEIAIQFPLSENIFFSEKERMDVYRSYAHDPNKVKRFFDGEWVEMAENSCFADVFNENLIVVGETLGANDDYRDLDNRDILRPWENSYQYDVGWDIGDQNTAVVLASPRQTGSTLCYDILDEVVILRKPLTMEEFVSMVMRMMDYWEKWMRTENKVGTPMWRHWSDSSSMTRRMTLGGTEAQMVYNLSGERISLYGVTKGRDSVDARKDMLRRLMYENRIAISSRCTGVLEMCRHLPPRVSKVMRDDLSGKEILVQDGIDKASKHKHAFDALTYMLGSCLPMNLSQTSSEKAVFRSHSMSLG